MRLMKGAIGMGRHPAGWKGACSMMIRKPGKQEYTKLNAYRSITLLSFMVKVVEQEAAELLPDEAKTRELLSDRQFGSSRGQSAIDAVAIMVDKAHAAWTNGHIKSVLLMDIKAAFLSVAKEQLVNMIKVSQIGGDLI